MFLILTKRFLNSYPVFRGKSHQTSYASSLSSGIWEVRFERTQPTGDFCNYFWKCLLLNQTLSKRILSKRIISKKNRLKKPSRAPHYLINRFFSTCGSSLVVVAFLLTALRLKAPAMFCLFWYVVNLVALCLYYFNVNRVRHQHWLDIRNIEIC